MDHCNKTLIVNNIQPYMDEDFLFRLFRVFGPIVQITIKISERTGVKYAFIEYENKDSSKDAFSKRDNFSFLGIRIFYGKTSILILILNFPI